MSQEKTRATTPAAAQTKAYPIVYRPDGAEPTQINQVLASLVFGLVVRHHAPSERALIGGKIERLLRRKTELGLQEGVCHGG